MEPRARSRHHNPGTTEVPRGAALPADPVADQQSGFQRQPCLDGQLHYHFDHQLKREGLQGAGSCAPSVALISDQDVSPRFDFRYEPVLLSGTATRLATFGGPVSKALSPDDPGQGLRAAEDRGFEPRRAVKPNRISSPFSGPKVTEGRSILTEPAQVSAGAPYKAAEAIPPRRNVRCAISVPSGTPVYQAAPAGVSAPARA